MVAFLLRNSIISFYFEELYFDAAWLKSILRFDIK